MQKAPLRPNEAQSLAALQSLEVLDSAPEAEFDALARAASLACGAPIALINLVDAERQWFKANIGLPGFTETPRELAFCAHAVLGDGLFEVPDATLDPRFADNPLVSAAPHVRFYAGAPIQLHGGQKVGTLCILDHQPRELNNSQRSILRCLATAAALALEGRLASRQLARSKAEQEERLRRLYEATPAMLHSIDAQGRVLAVSDQWLSRLGYARDQVVGRMSTDFLTPASRDYARQVVLPKFFASGRCDQIAYQMLASDGSLVDVLLSATLERDAAGQPVRSLAVSEDISARKRLEAQLAASSARVQDLYDHAPCGYHSLDADGRILHINATALDWLGCSRDEVIGQLSMADFLTAEGQAQLAQSFGPLMATGHVDGLEFDLVPRRGAGRRVSLAATAVCDEQGRYRMSRSVMFDITDLHRARQALQQITREQSAMLDSELVGLAKVCHRHFVWVNRGLARMLGYAPGELVGQPTSVLYADQAVYHRVGEALEPARMTDSAFRAQLTVSKKDGGVLWLDASSARLSDGSGESFVVFIDITALKNAEAVRIQSMALDAENAQLRETGRLKDQFLANMSHELRTPLNAVIGLTHLLQSGAIQQDSPKYIPYISQIGASGQHLLELIESMLDYAQVESGKIEFRPAPVNLADAIQEVIALLQATCDRRGVTISAAVSSDLGPVQLDPLRLRQVLSNLMGNAVKFSRAGGRVDVRVASDGPVFVRMEIVDAGIGIAADDLPKLFTRFNQLSTGNTKSHEGTGLGLALVRRLVEAQGGQVGVRSTLGAGSVFHVTLPRAPIAFTA
jgi:PAS domain S-box-containing protein